MTIADVKKAMAEVHRLNRREAGTGESLRANVLNQIVEHIAKHGDQQSRAMLAVAMEPTK